MNIAIVFLKLTLHFSVRATGAIMSYGSLIHCKKVKGEINKLKDIEGKVLTGLNGSVIDSRFPIIFHTIFGLEKSFDTSRRCQFE